MCSHKLLALQYVKVYCALVGSILYVLYSCISIFQGIGSEQIEATEHEPCRKRLRTQNSIELVRRVASCMYICLPVISSYQMKLRIQSSSSDQDPITTPVRKCANLLCYI